MSNPLRFNVRTVLMIWSLDSFLPANPKLNKVETKKKFFSFWTCTATSMSAFSNLFN